MNAFGPEGALGNIIDLFFKGNINRMASLSIKVQQFLRGKLFH
jgi:lipoprotein signal peptidase